MFEAIVGPDDAVISDALNHASMIDGIRLCKAKKFVYKNKDLAGNVQEETKQCCLFENSMIQPFTAASHSCHPWGGGERGNSHIKKMGRSAKIIKKPNKKFQNLV